MEILHIQPKSQKLNTLEQYEIYRHTKIHPNDILNTQLNFKTHTLLTLHYERNLIGNKRRQDQQRPVLKMTENRSKRVNKVTQLLDQDLKDRVRRQTHQRSRSLISLLSDYIAEVPCSSLTYPQTNLLRTSPADDLINAMREDRMILMPNVEKWDNLDKNPDCDLVCHKISPIPRLTVRFRNKLFFYGDGLLALRPTPKLEDHPYRLSTTGMFYGQELLGFGSPVTWCLDCDWRTRNDTMRAFNEIADLVTKQIVPVKEGIELRNTTEAPSGREASDNDTPTSTTPFTITQNEFFRILRRNLRGLARVFNMESRKAIEGAILSAKTRSRFSPRKAKPLINLVIDELPRSLNTPINLVLKLMN
ncbi:hypothetical protein ANN_11018 [Periplaneta americana]|uniref:Uncharacterized protein n=1 Tax=Periplaneta americana TaxID=6978 RepID=A0ABQ8T5I8_PERAM|nr:hypothetical protein ANN_11018 [Periplaneta americana]